LVRKTLEKCKELSFTSGCYDAWNDEEYPNGARYNRTRFMNDDGSIVGVYSCICQNSMMRCSGIVINFEIFEERNA